MAAAKSSGRSPSMNLVVMPKRGRSTLSWLYVPPYRFGVDTMLSPAWASAAKVRNCAEWPDAVATAPIPPSRAAIRFSNTSLVGCMRRTWSVFYRVLSCCVASWANNRAREVEKILAFIRRL